MTQPLLSRRTVLTAGVAARSAAGGDPARRSLLRAENALPGTLDWQLTFMRTDPRSGGYRSRVIEGYASKMSVKAGETIALMVSVDPPGEFELDLYRMGYYQGLGGRQVAHLGPFAGTTQPTPAVDAMRLRECQWTPCVTMTIPRAWVSGVYLAKLTRRPSSGDAKSAAHRYQSYVIFIVRDERKADIVFQCSDNTWHAYNRWPDSYSLYTYDPGNTKPLLPGVAVSFNRPYAKYPQVVDAPLSIGSGEFLLWEFPLAFWLEQHGYDVTYLSNSDVHVSADGLLRGKYFLSVGHDEYWSLEQFNHVSQARDAGVNLAFLSGNTCCFVTPFSPSTSGQPNRIITRAGRYGGVSKAEEAYMGPFPLDGPNENTLLGARTVSPFNGSGDWIVTKADHWLFKRTGMKNGDRIPGLVGWEFHGDPAQIPGLEVVAAGTTVNSGDRMADWTATIYPGPKGNHVFNASTIFWSEGLSAPPGHLPPHSHYGRPHGPDPRVQRITRNLLQRLTV